MAGEFPTGKRAKAGRVPGPLCSCGKEEPELVVVYLHHLHRRGLAGLVFHHEPGKGHVQGEGALLSLMLQLAGPKPNSPKSCPGCW